MATGLVVYAFSHNGVLATLLGLALLASMMTAGVAGAGIPLLLRRMGFDPELLPWYHGLELFDSWRWVRHTGKPYEQHTDERLRGGLGRWLDQ